MPHIKWLMSNSHNSINTSETCLFHYRNYANTKIYSFSLLPLFKPYVLINITQVLTRFWSSMRWVRSNGERLWLNWIYWNSVSASTWNLDVRSYCCHPSWSTQGWLGWWSSINTIQLKTIRQIETWMSI